MKRFDVPIHDQPFGDPAGHLFAVQVLDEIHRDLVEYRDVQDLELTWADKLLLKGELKGRRETLLRLLAQKFGPLPESATARVEAYESVDELDACLERILTVTTLEELGLDA